MSHNKLSKHDLKDDNFVTYTLKAWEYLRENQNKFFIGLVILVVVAATAVWMGNSRTRARETAREQFSEALASFRTGQFKTAEEMFKIIEERYGSLEEGAAAPYFIGRCALLQGRNSDAVKSFEKYLGKASKQPFYRDAAMEGMAVAWENDRDYAKAADIYLELAESLKANTFMETTYLKRAADLLKLSNQNSRAVEVLEKLLARTKGKERIEIELELGALKS